MNQTIQQIVQWMETNELQLAPEKTELLILAGRRKLTNISVNIGKQIITKKSAVKYLGIWLDQDLKICSHIRNTCENTDKIILSLSRLMPNINGSSSRKRSILCSVAHFLLTYVAPIWIEILKEKKYKNMLRKTYRKCLLRLATAYLTVSNEALEVITATLPIDIMAEERSQIHWEWGTKVENEGPRESSIRKFQQRWDENTNKARWTK